MHLHTSNDGTDRREEFALGLDAELLARIQAMAEVEIAATGGR